MRCASGSTPARCRGRCCPPANASAPPRSARRNTACSSPATPAPSPIRARCCRGAISRCCSRPTSARRRSIPTSSRPRSARTSPRSTSMDGEAEVALALRWRGAPSHERIFAFAQGIVRGMPRTVAQKKPLYIMLDGDVAQTLGAILREELGVRGRDPGDRRRGAVGFRLHRPRPHPPAVDDRAGDDQVTGVQRGPAAAARRDAFASSRHSHDTVMGIITTATSIVSPAPPRPFARDP